MAFVKNTTPTFPRQPQHSEVRITDTDLSNQKTVYTAGTSGSKVVSLIAENSDAAPYDVQVSITNGGTSYPLGTVTVPASAGSVAGTPPTDIISAGIICGLPLDNDGQPYVYLISGDTLTISSLTTVTTGQFLTFNAAGGDF